MGTLVESLRREVVARLNTGEFRPGDLLPSFRELQEWVGARGVGTVQAALEPLIDVGLLRGEPGRGVRVVSWPGDARQRRALAQLGIQVGTEPSEVGPPRTADQTLSSAVDAAADALTGAAEALRVLATHLRTRGAAH